ncbi:MAG: methyltransferase domain-containing protein [Gammaproteobacteria bacterium]|nr:methyltransferase domain-containing protein [Gammaproteobacteria bacterium]
MRLPIALMCAILAALVVPYRTGSAADTAQTGAESDASAAIAAAIEDPRRLPGDRARDAGRKPEAILAFAGLRPGMEVLDMFSGGGYYTQLAASVVGPAGKVVAHNNTPYASIAGSQIEQRYADGRLPSVEQILGENNKLALPAGAFDVALLILCYHDVYYIDGQRGWERIDRPLMLAELYSAVKPGGVVLVVDHVADPGTPDDVIAGLHRIDPALVKADFTAAGFRFDAESDVLSNENDPRDVIAMAPHVRGKTDRAVLRFRRPANP